jgi:Lon protease-like protein
MRDRLADLGFSGTVPVFPLPHLVFFPDAFLPLHVFEPRYRALVQACLDGTPEFGVALIERGSEVGGGDTRFDVACVARIVEAVSMPDGRWALGTVGARRIRVDEWLDDDPYPRADVTPWPDPPAGTAAAEAREPLLAATRRLLALSAELGEAVAPATVDVDEDPVLAVYQLAAIAPLGPLDRLSLLGAPGPDERAALLGRLLEEAVEVAEARLDGRA